MQEGQVRARALGCRPWGRNSTLFAVILKGVFKQKFRPKYAQKCVFFWKKL